MNNQQTYYKHTQLDNYQSIDHIPKFKSTSIQSTEEKASLIHNPFKNQYNRIQQLSLKSQCPNNQNIINIQNPTIFVPTGLNQCSNAQSNSSSYNPFEQFSSKVNGEKYYFLNNCSKTYKCKKINDKKRRYQKVPMQYGHQQNVSFQKNQNQFQNSLINNQATLPKNQFMDYNQAAQSEVSQKQSVSGIKLNIRSQLIRRSRKYQISTNNAHKKYINCLKNLFYQALSQQQIIDFQKKYIKQKSCRVFFFIILVYVKYRFSSQLALAVKYGFQKQMNARIKQYEEQIYRCSDFMLKNYRYQQIHQIQIALKAIQQFYRGNSSEAIQYLYRKDKHIIVKQNHFRSSLHYIEQLQKQFSAIQGQKITQPYIKDHYHRKYNPEKMTLKQKNNFKDYIQARNYIQTRNNMRDVNNIVLEYKPTDDPKQNEKISNAQLNQGNDQKQQNLNIEKKLINQSQSNKSHNQQYQSINKNNMYSSFIKPSQLIQQKNKSQLKPTTDSIAIETVKYVNQPEAINTNKQSAPQIWHVPQLSPNEKSLLIEQEQQIQQGNQIDQQPSQQQSSGNFHQNLTKQKYFQLFQQNKSINLNQKATYIDQMIFPPIPPSFYVKQFDQKYGYLFRKLIYINKWKQLNRSMMNRQNSMSKDNNYLMNYYKTNDTKNMYVPPPLAFSSQFMNIPKNI